mmetsp:Transcript_30332/g.97793  ORF Transcript_30332/g.97793 Transcript_30332/m.97793 type:complete len:266 (+) Transcript_30332:22-819(+)
MIFFGTLFLAVAPALLCEAYAPTSGRRVAPRPLTTMGAESAATKLRQECLDALSRLSSRASHVAIQTIKDIQIARVAEDAVDLQVVSCDDDRCVALHVPLELPVVCRLNEEGFDECVLRNIATLDRESEATARFHDARDAMPQQVATSPTLAVYGGGGGFAEKPPWWRDPPRDSLELRTACLDVKDILNGKDFDADLRKVANRLLRREIAAARVDAVGPSGVLLTAIDEATRDPLPVALPFDGGPCADPRELRRSVVGLVERAGA